MIHLRPNSVQYIHQRFILLCGWGSLHNFADDSTLSDQADSIGELVENSQYLSKVAINWMDQNNIACEQAKSLFLVDFNFDINVFLPLSLSLSLGLFTG